MLLLLLIIIITSIVVDDEANMNSFPMEQLLPNQTADYFTYYNGSLTSPPCYQSAIWMVFRYPITITKYQVISHVCAVVCNCRV